MDYPVGSMTLPIPSLAEKGFSMGLHLPDEILLIIIDYLDFETLIAFAKTCDKINNLCISRLATETAAQFNKILGLSLSSRLILEDELAHLYLFASSIT